MQRTGFCAVLLKQFTDVAQGGFPHMHFYLQSFKNFFQKRLAFSFYLCYYNQADRV